MKQSIFLTVLLVAGFAQAEINIRFGSNSGESRMSDVNQSGQQSFFFSGSNSNLDLIFYMGRLGIGGRYTKLDTIQGYNVNSGSQSQATEISPSSVRLLNSGLSALVSLRFYSSEFETEFRMAEKGDAKKIPSKTFGDLVMTAGKANQFQMITKDEAGAEALYSATNVDNFSASLLAGYQITALILGLEAGYREMHVHNARTNSTDVNREDAYKIGYPFVGATIGLGF
jgi:hypothetical protein